MSNDDDLYGDLYGNDGGDFNGYEDEQPESNEETAGSSEPVKPAQTSSKSAPADTKPINGTNKTETSAALSAKIEEPLTNPIPTFTEDSHSAGSMGTSSNARNTASSSNVNSTHGLPPNPSGAPIHTIESVDSSRQSGMKDEG
ncbi:SubName: Full=Uncharacterized protein {ECO:0000313/EMBL:CCA73742.1} [Serendipita indica DSM 11827]|uniref:Uncharacterized protein n=1 Tax=Serendipita indica (strain DSM 11827) TaxID=1109443 RepID=G4TQZ9_SERID|nr:SubName: Full=Uncharacterized protein {ECO:0000313/EMBL:CCA73742.1} [Serendipita indica DSM 11827]CCA73742.1 hypothetical protein PIIN_07697 [Serendipita indica DSM 11827]